MSGLFISGQSGRNHPAGKRVQLAKAFRTSIQAIIVTHMPSNRNIPPTSRNQPGIFALLHLLFPYVLIKFSQGQDRFLGEQKWFKSPVG